MRVAAVVLAGGSGQRAGLGRNKVLASLGGTSVLERSVAAFAPHVTYTIVVARPADRVEILTLLGNRVTAVVDGGSTRHGSEAAGMAAAAELGCDVVAVHAGARPLVDDATIGRVLAEAAKGRAAVPALPLTVPLARWPRSGTGPVLDDAMLVQRHGLVRVQTPQAAPLEVLRDAFARSAAGDDPLGELLDTVEPVLRHRPDIEVVAVEGTPRNLKVTWAADLSRAERLLERPDLRPDPFALRLRDGRPTGGAPVAHLEVDGVTPVTDALRLVRDTVVVAALDRVGLVDVAGDLLAAPGVLPPDAPDLADAVEQAVTSGAVLRLRRRR